MKGTVLYSSQFTSKCNTAQTSRQIQHPSQALRASSHRNLLQWPQNRHQYSRHAALVCLAARRVPLVKRREKLPARQRRRPINQDIPRPFPVPSFVPEFLPRLLIEVNNAKGPRQLAQLVSDHGPLMPAQHVASVLSRLAGFATDGGLDEVQATALSRCGPRCISLLQWRADEAEPLMLARAAYSMYRLGLYDEELANTIVAFSFNKLSTFQADALAGLVAALGGWGHRPPRPWLERACLECYARMRSYGAQELASMAFGLAKLGHVPSEAWQDAAHRRFRDAATVAGANSPAFVKFGWALVQFQMQPSFNWMLAFCSEVRQRIDLYTARELATLIWVCIRLKHVPDPLFLEAWFKAATRRMPTFTPPSLLLALQSLAAAELHTPAPATFMRALLPKLQDMFPAMSGPELAEALWCVVSLRLKPDEQWMDQYMAACESSVGSLPPQAMADCAWALARLRYQPSEAWEEAAAAQVSENLSTYTAAQLGVLIWAWVSVELSPVPEAWRVALVEHARTEGIEESEIKDVQRLVLGMAERNTIEGRNEAAGWKPQQQQQQQQQQQEPQGSNRQPQRRRAPTKVNRREALQI